MRPTWLVRCFFERPFVVQGPLPSAATSQPSRGSRFYSGLSGLGTRLEGRRPLRQETVLERSSRFASDYRWDPTEELDRQESDRKVLDDFFESPETPEMMGRSTPKDGEFLKDESGILDNFSLLKEKQEEERMAELGLRPARNKFFKAPEDKTRDVDDEGSVYSHGAELLNEKTHSYFNSAPPVPITKRRERRQERAHKLLLDNIEKAKQKKRRLYRRDTQDYSKTRRQLRMDVELFQMINDALGFDQAVQPLRDAQIVIDDVKVAVSMRKARVYWSLALEDNSEESFRKGMKRARNALKQYGSALRYATQQRIQMKKAPELDFIYAEMKNPILVDHLNKSMKVIDHVLSKHQQKEAEDEE